MRLALVSVVSLPLFLLNVSAEQSSAAEPSATIVSVERWACLFGGRETTLHFRIVKPETDPGIDGRIHWHYSANQRTLFRGEFEIGRDGQTEAEVRLRVPSVRDKVIFKTELTVAYVPRGENAETATLKKTLWLFPEDPFVDQRKVFKDRRVAIFDPEGRTAELFDEIELPYQRIRHAAASGDPTEHSYVIIGEGTSLVRNRGLADRLLRFAAAGGTVLMLAPSDGTLPLPGEGDEPRPGELRFRQHHVIREFDNRLDSKFLPGTSDFAGSKVTLRTRLSRVGMEVSEDGDWPWVMIEYPNTKGRFIFCGFNIVKNWNNGPTPRFLLNRLLTP